MNDVNNGGLPKIGVIGLGDMGFPIACNLLTSGYPVLGFDINERTQELFAKEGGIVAGSIVEVVDQCDVVMTSLPSSEVFVSVAEKQLVPNTRKGQIFIELGTTIPNDVKRLEKLFIEKGADLLDTPVSGGKVGAERAQLKMFVGGEKSIYEKCYQILVTIAGPNTIYYCGPSGSGQAMKGVNQLQMGMLSATCLEILSFAVHSGLSLELIQEVFPEPSYKITTSVAKRIAAGEGNDVGVKFRELPYYIRQAEEQGYELPLTKLVYDFCNKGERVVIDDHRDAPSFWNELTKDTL